MTELGYNPAFVSKLLDRAGHPQTCDHEALTALRFADRHVAKVNKSLGDIVRIVEGEFFVPLMAIPATKFLEKNAALELKLFDANKALKNAVADTDRLKEANQTLANENAELQSRLDRAGSLLIAARASMQAMRRKLTAVAVPARLAPPEEPLAEVAVQEESVTQTRYARLREIVLSRRNVGKAWRAIFCQLTHTSMFVLDSWRDTDNVPDAAFEMARTMNFDRYKRPEYTIWSHSENQRFGELVKSGYCPHQISSMMGKEFKRKFSPGALTARARFVKTS